MRLRPPSATSPRPIAWSRKRLSRRMNSDPVQIPNGGRHRAAGAGAARGTFSGLPRPAHNAKSLPRDGWYRVHRQLHGPPVWFGK